MRDPEKFFVGYLPMPARLVSFYRIVIPAVLLLATAIALWVASGQQSPGKGAGDLSAEQQLTGYLTVDPYPVLHFVGNKQQSVLLVEQIKKSANELARPFANQWVTLSGLALQRGDWHMLQLPADADFAPAPPRPGKTVTIADIGPVSLQGEIIDSKCFLGAMKPGGGKVHRACASLCLLGGLPPMLVVKDKAGERFGYVLMNADGSSASIDLSALVAVPVEVSGQLVQRGDLQYIRLGDNSIQRLAGQDLLAYGETLAMNDAQKSHHDHH